MSAKIKGASPYLYYPDAAKALDWLSRVFGFKEIARYQDDKGVVHEAETAAGDTTIMMAGGRGPEPNEGKGLLIIVHVDDVQAQHRRVTEAGVEAQEPHEEAYGPVRFAVKDPWGYVWDFWQKVKPFVDGTAGLKEVRSDEG